MTKFFLTMGSQITIKLFVKKIIVHQNLTILKNINVKLTKRNGSLKKTYFRIVIMRKKEAFSSLVKDQWLMYLSKQHQAQ
jgi:hypothetical protein